MPNDKTIEQVKIDKEEIKSITSEDPPNDNTEAEVVIGKPNKQSKKDKRSRKYNKTGKTTCMTKMNTHFQTVKNARI